MNFSKEDNFTGLTHKFSISNVEEIKDDECRFINFTVTTEMGEVDLSEHLYFDKYSEEFRSERTDSNIKINQVDELYSLFPALKDFSGPIRDITPVDMLLDLAEEILSEKKKSEKFLKSRLEMGFSQADLAKKLGWSTTQVSNIENGRRKVQKQTELAIMYLRTMKK